LFCATEARALSAATGSDAAIVIGAHQPARQMAAGQHATMVGPPFGDLPPSRQLFAAALAIANVISMCALAWLLFGA